MKCNVFVEHQQTAPKAKGKKTPAAAAGGPGGRAVDAGEGVVVKQERGDDSDKENEEGNLGTAGLSKTETKG